MGWFGWRAAFWINVPVSVAALVMALLGVYVILAETTRFRELQLKGTGDTENPAWKRRK